MKKNEPMLFNMASLIAGIETDDNIVGKPRENEENIFYVLTNREKSFASFYMLLPEIQEKLMTVSDLFMYCHPVSMKRLLSQRKISMICTEM